MHSQIWVIPLVSGLLFWRRSVTKPAVMSTNVIDVLSTHSFNASKV